MNATEMKLVIEAALLAAGRPLPFEKLVEVFTRKGDAPDRAAIREALGALAADYEGRGIELKEVGSGFRIQIRASMADWLQPLWEERAPRYTRALLETLALIAYRQPITRSEIEEVRGVAVSSNIVRTLMERGWIRVVGHRDVPGKPAMLGTTREFLDYFGLKKLEDLPALTEFNEEHPELSPQGDLIASLGQDGTEASGEESFDAAADGTPPHASDAADADGEGDSVAFAGAAASDAEAGPAPITDEDQADNLGTRDPSPSRDGDPGSNEDRDLSASREADSSSSNDAGLTASDDAEPRIAGDPDLGADDDNREPVSDERDLSSGDDGAPRSQAYDANTAGIAREGVRDEEPPAEEAGSLQGDDATGAPQRNQASVSPLDEPPPGKQSESGGP